MNKRIISLLICFMILILLTLPVYATTEETTTEQLVISTADDFMEFAENCRLDSYSKNLSVTLEDDIDLSKKSFTCIPVFCGVFDGNGHTVSGLSITAEGSVQGLFRYLTADAIVRNLSVAGNIQPGGSRDIIGAIAGHNEGQILKCTFTGSISGADYIGGITGINTVTGIIDNCHVDGEIHGDHFVGGIAGENYGVIRSCTGKSLINTTPKQNSVDIGDINMDTLTNTEAANTVTDIGGIAGISSGVIRDCKNFGDVGYRHMGYNIGGIAGTQSGYMVNCENHGSVHGRKEVGGIVGQMEPATLIQYSEDTLQILKRQLDDLSGKVHRTSGNLQTNADQVNAQLAILQDQTKAAQDAVTTLIPDPSNPELPDPDITIASLNTLSAAINAIPGTLRSISSATQTAAENLSRDLNDIIKLINAMEITLSGASENLGGSLTDVSDLDTAETLTGKAENCINLGNILADLNVGGIAGAIAIENDLDILEDWKESGNESLNFESQIRAVIANCANQGTTTGKKQNAGGIVGWQSLGLIKNCTNTGKMECPGADFAGGIAGLSTGYIRSSYAKCKIDANTNVGGIAGSGSIVTDCLALVNIQNATEKSGSIIGSTEITEEEISISNNYYLCVDTDYGAIDGINYSGKAESLPADQFLQSETTPDIFRTVTIRFLFESGEYEEVSIPSAGSLDPDDIPNVPRKDGFTGVWEHLESAQLNNILFDMTFNAVYTSYRTTIEAEEKRENGLSVLLIEGLFSDAATVSISRSDSTPALANKEIPVESWTIHMNEAGTTARYLLPDGVNAESVKLMLCSSNGMWRTATFTQDGSYLVFALDSDDQQLAVIAKPADHTFLIITGTSILALGFVVTFFILHKKKSRRNPN